MASRSEAYFLSFLLVIVILLASAAVPIQATFLRGQSGNYSGLGVMRPDQETLREWVNRYDNAPRVALGSEPRLIAGYPQSFSLLNHIQYTPSERNQGYCGNCWAWAATGVLEVALDVQGVNRDRVSVQYLNSNYNGGTGTGWACCGGWLNNFASFYTSKGLAIPWSNTNAAWSDGGKGCGDYPTSVPASSISTTPRYPITSITDEVVSTQGQGQATAISNIKGVLNQNRAVWFAFYLVTQADWDAFGDFWFNQPETAVWNMDLYSGHTWASGGAGHAVLIVGYDDSNPSNRYWIALNSWGTAYGGRPNGLFRLKMDIDYDDWFYDPRPPYPGYYYSLYWQTLSVTFGNRPLTVTVTPPGSGSVALSPAGGSYPAGTAVKATANPSSGYSFLVWGLDSYYAGNSNPITIVMNLTHTLKAYFQAPSQWIKAASNPVLTASAGAWDNGTVLQPRIFTYANGTLGMVYRGHNGTAGAVGLATSPNGLQWMKYPSAVLVRDTSGAWDNLTLWPGSVVWDGSQFVLYYLGAHNYWFANGTRRTTYGFGRATSADSIHWTKYAGNPILTPSGDAENTYFAEPYVIKVGDTYKMWYTAGSGINLATSTDGTAWTRANAALPVLAPSSSLAWEAGALYNAAVVYDPVAGDYKMSYSGTDADFVVWRVGLARSPDGISWTKYYGNPIIGPSALGWDSGDSTDNQGILLRNGQLMIYYSGAASSPVYHDSPSLLSYSIGLAYASEIPLRAGWNLISLPVVPSSNSITSLLSPLIAANELTIVWSYTGTPRAWKFFKPGTSSALTAMNDGEGYWIYMRAVDTLYVGGYVIAPTYTPPSYPLVAGWNLVGFKPQPTVTSETVDAYLSSIAGVYDVNGVWLYDNSNGTWIQATASTMLYPGDAMWVRTTAAATLYPG